MLQLTRHVIVFRVGKFFIPPLLRQSWHSCIAVLVLCQVIALLLVHRAVRKLPHLWQEHVVVSRLVLGFILPSCFATLRWFRLAVQFRVFTVEAAVLRIGRAALLLAPRLLLIWVILGELLLVAGLALLEVGASAIPLAVPELLLDVGNHALLGTVVGI